MFFSSVDNQTGQKEKVEEEEEKEKVEEEEEKEEEEELYRLPAVAEVHL